jgi:hypothetical protein
VLLSPWFSLLLSVQSSFPWRARILRPPVCLARRRKGSVAFVASMLVGSDKPDNGNFDFDGIIQCEYERDSSIRDSTPWCQSSPPVNQIKSVLGSLTNR